MNEAIIDEIHESQLLCILSLLLAINYKPINSFIIGLQEQLLNWTGDINWNGNDARS